MALVLSRKTGEKVVLEIPGYDDVIIEVLEFRPPKVRLAFDAQDEILIRRAELESRKTW